jgi:hypothetical protein
VDLFTAQPYGEAGDDYEAMLHRNLGKPEMDGSL